MSVAAIPGWLHLVSIVSPGSGAACAAVIAYGELRHPQHMWIMNIVWPVTALNSEEFWFMMQIAMICGSRPATP